jgi:hypothetical protein
VRRLILALALVTLLVGGRIGRTDWFDGMESATPTWRLLESDCNAKAVAQRRTGDQVQEGNLSEFVEVHAGSGQKAYLGYAIDASHAIDELQISLWVRSDVPGIDLHARVVFPRTLDEQGAPLRKLIPGDTYVQPGAWNRLAVHQLRSQVERHAQSLRSELRRPVDTRGAYVDLIVLNVYDRPGKRSLWIDQLEIVGQVPIERTGIAAAGMDLSHVRPATALEPIEPLSSGASAEVRRQGRLLLVDERPFFGRMIDRTDETLEFLASLGAEVVRLRYSPTPFDRSEARRLNLRLVCPPPALDQVTDWDESWRPILAWSLEEVPAEKRTSLREALRLHPLGRRRPEMLLADDPTRTPHDAPSLLLHDGVWLGGSRDLREFPAWLAQRRKAEAGDVPFFVSVATHWPQAADRQASAMAADWEGGAPFDSQAVRLMTHLAIGSQARGIYLRSERSLQDPTSYARQRASCVRMIFQELRLWEPWIAGGEAATPRKAGAWDLYELAAGRSRALFCIRQSPNEQCVLVPESPLPLSIFVDGSTSAMAFRVRDAGLEKVDQADSPGGRTLALTDAGRIEAFLLTQDMTAHARFRKEWAAWKRARSDRERDALAASIAVAEETERRLGLVGLSSPESLRRIEWVHANRKRMDELAGKDQEREIRALAEQATRSLAAVRRDAWKKLSREGDAYVSTPFGCGYEGLAWRWRFSDAFHSVPATGDLLRGGDFEDLAATAAAGWSNQQTNRPGIATSVRITPQAVYRGSAGLEATATVVGVTSGSYQGTRPLATIETPSLRLSPGTVVCIHGMARFDAEAELPQASFGDVASPRGARIVDSIGGEAMALYLSGSGGWKPFSLYRVANDQPLVVTFELFAPGTLRLDEVVARPVELP